MISKFPLLFYLFHFAPWQVPDDYFVVGMQSMYVAGAARATLFVNHKYLHGSYSQSVGPGLTIRESSLFAPIPLTKHARVLTGLTYHQNAVAWDTRGRISGGCSFIHQNKEYTSLLRVQADLTGSYHIPQWQFRELYQINENWSLGAGWDYLPYRPDPLTLQCTYTHDRLQLTAQVQGNQTSLGMTLRRHNLYLKVSLSSRAITPSSTLLFVR